MLGLSFALVQISSAVRDLVRESRTVEVLRQLVGDDVKCMQTMMFMKGAGKPGQATHQDEYYIQTRDRRGLTMFTHTHAHTSRAL